MLKPETHLVTADNGPRPAGPPDECFYCQAALGEHHRPNCVLRIRSVVVRATIEYVIDVPESWDRDLIEFVRNESSWCASNMIDELRALDACLCPIVEFEYVREAEAEDEQWNASS